ncbi:MAG: phosphoglycolate phosphatase [Hyphomicrobium sp.]|nr:phosphoglycolate phosphatase [Hyphomicrobium sp.]
MRDLTLVFDLDGTLVDTAPDLIASTNHVLDHLGLPRVDADTLRPFVGHGARHMIERAVGPAAERMTPAQHEALLARYLDYYGSHIADGSRPFEGLLPLLAKFQTAGVKLAVCTNKMEAMSRLLLDALDMSRYFVAVAGRDSLRTAKPHPEALLGTIRMAGGNKSRAVMIGDSGVDVATAKAAGVPVIGVSFGYTETPVAEFAPDAVIDHYRELEPAIASVLAPSRIDGAR